MNDENQSRLNFLVDMSLEKNIKNPKLVMVPPMEEDINSARNLSSLVLSECCENEQFV